jgi:hypothetical protein
VGRDDGRHSALPVERVPVPQAVHDDVDVSIHGHALHVECICMGG